MNFIARLLLATVLAAFAASTVAYAAGSAEMAAMVASDDGVMEMSECDPCGDFDAGELGVACNVVCGAGGFAAVLAPQVQGIVQAPRETLGPVVTQVSGGLAGPPAKEPPRTLI